MSGPLWAVTSYYNPAGYRRRRANYQLFRERLPLPLLTVEWSPTGEFELRPGDADMLVQLSGGDVMWQKERLLNIGVGRLPAQCTHVAWVDCDLVFEREDLGDAVLAALEAAPLVQLFDRVAYLAPTTLDALARLGNCANGAINLSIRPSCCAPVWKPPVSQTSRNLPREKVTTPPSEASSYGPWTKPVTSIDLRRWCSKPCVHRQWSRRR